MSFELKKESVKTGKGAKDTTVEQKTDMEIALPDYCADIKKILRCTFLPGIHTVSISGENVSAKGTGVIRIIYLSEGDKIDSFEKSCDLSSRVQLKELSPEAVVTAQASVDFVNCRAVSQRKIAVSASVSTVYSLYACVDESFAVAKEKENLQFKTEKLNCEETVGFYEKTFDMAETVVLNSEHPAVGKILLSNCRAVCESRKLSSGKLLIKGEAVTEICYISEKEEKKVYTFTHSMPISQIVDVRDVNDGADCDIELKVCQHLCTVKADSSGSNRLVDLSLRISAFVNFSAKKECEVITDCYCTDCEIEEKYEKSELLCPVRKIDEIRQHKSEVELSSSVKEICFVRCVEINKSIRFAEDKISFDCNALFFIMYIDENDVPCCCEKNIDFDFDYLIAKKCAEPFGSFSVQAVCVSGVKSGADKAEISLDYKVKGAVYCFYENKILKNLTLCEDNPKTFSSVALCVYFAEEGESLWNIAKDHNTTVELIMKENNLKNQKTVQKGMLLIPCV